MGTNTLLDSGGMGSSMRGAPGKPGGLSLPVMPEECIAFREASHSIPVL